MKMPDFLKKHKKEGKQQIYDNKSAQQLADKERNKKYSNRKKINSSLIDRDLDIFFGEIDDEDTST